MVAYPHQVIDQFTMQALAMRSEFALTPGMLSAGGQIALAFLPAEPVLAVLVHPALVVIVLRIVGPALSLHLALHAAFLPVIWFQLLAERFELNRPLPGEDRQAGWTNIEPDRVSPRVVLDFLVGCALQDQLDHISVALAVC